MLHIFQPLITFQYDVGHFELFIESEDGVTHTLVDQPPSTLGQPGTELEEDDAARGVHSGAGGDHCSQLLGGRVRPRPRHQNRKHLDLKRNTAVNSQHQAMLVG